MIKVYVTVPRQTFRSLLCGQFRPLLPKSCLRRRCSLVHEGNSAARLPSRCWCLVLGPFYAGRNFEGPVLASPTVKGKKV